MLKLATKTINLIREQLINAIANLILSREEGVSIPQGYQPKVRYNENRVDEDVILTVEYLTTFDGTSINACGVSHYSDGSPFQDTPELSRLDTDGLLALYKVLQDAIDQQEREERAFREFLSRQA